MKYVYVVLGAVLIAFTEAMVGSVSPFNYVSYLFIAGAILLWLFEVRMGIVLVLVGAIFLDIFIGNWVGTALISFFFALLLLGLVNSIFHLDSESRRPIGGGLHLALSMFFNHFLIILQDNGFKEISWDYFVYHLVASLVIFGILWIILNSSGVKKTSFYR